MKRIQLLGVVAVAAVTAVSAAQARDQIRIVGSSTVFPFSAAVAERFGRDTDFPTPVVESTGSGGGLKLFCSGIGENHPDIANASRRIKSSEFGACAEAGIDMIEVKIGFDGIVIGNANGGPELDLTLKQIFQALARQVPVDGKLVDNPYRMWSDIDPTLPPIKIEVLGPPPTSGTRDAFVELAMEAGAREFDMLAEMDSDEFKRVAHTLREDGAFVEAGENDNLIVQKLAEAPERFGIFGFSFLDQNADRIKGARIGGVEPEFEQIADGAYPVSRSLYFYVKKPHLGKIPGLAEFVAEFTSEAAWGDDGYLADKGLIPLPAAERSEIAEAAASGTALSGL